MTFPAEVWLDGHRVRCEVCCKVVFPTEATAVARAGEITRDRQPMRAYYGRRCGHWHLARDKAEMRRRDMARQRAGLPKCCTMHIGRYVDIDPTEYPRERAALCCPECFARLVYTEGQWQRTAQEEMKVDPMAVRDPKKAAAVAKAMAPKPKQRVVQGGLLDGLL